MFLRKAQCIGQVRLPGAHIIGNLACDEAVFSNPDGNALTGDNLSVDADMWDSPRSVETSLLRRSDGQVPQV